MDFQDRRVWITGASSGIGEALALAFHQAGAKLILSARREDELKRVQAACAGEPNTRILPLDVTNAAELAEKTRLSLSLFNASTFWYSMPASLSDLVPAKLTRAYTDG